MAKKSSSGIVLPTRKMTPEQLAEQLHFARRAKKQAFAPKTNRGGRAGARRSAIASGW